MKFTTLKTMLLAGATVLGMAGGASALTFGSIPGSPGVTNDALVPLFGAGTTSLNGWYGAELFLVAAGPVSITATYLGSEAGNNNSFSFGGTTIQTGGGTNTFNPAGITSWVVNNVAPGSLSFSFSTSGGGLSVSNGSNPDNTVPAASPGVNFFTSFVGNQNASRGQGVYLFFDDDGAANDDNHDDMVVRLDIRGGEITVVPLPAAGLLLLTALGGVAALRRRRKAA